MRSAQASIVKVGNNHYRVFVEAGRDAKTGKRKRYTKTVRGSRKDAEKVKTDLLIKAGNADVHSDVTFGEYALSVYLPEKRAQLKTTSYEAYERRLAQHVIPLIGDEKLCDLTAQAIRRAISSIEGPKVQREARRMVHMVCQHAVYNDHLQSNPCDRVQPPRVERYEPEVLDEQDIEVYLWHFKGTRAEPIVLLALGGAFRRGEMVALNAEDIDRETGATVIDDSIVPTNAGPERGDPKTENGFRVVHLPKAILSRLVEVMPERGPVIRRLDGKRYSPASVTHVYERERDRLPEVVPRISLKNLRHTSLTLSYDSGADILDVSNRAGHSGTAITARYYLRPKGERDKKTALLMDEALCDKMCQFKRIRLVSGVVESF